MTTSTPSHTNTSSAPVGRRTLFAASGVALASLALGATAAPAEAAPITTAVNRSAVVETARRGIGVRYRSGGTTTSGWDCSGFTQWVFAQHGVSLPHSASAQKRLGRKVPKGAAVPGDLVVWPGHVGVYAGGNQVIDAGNRCVNTSQRKVWGRPTYVRIGA